MKICFKLGNGFEILRFDLNGNKIENLEVFHEGLANAVLRNPACVISPSSLLELFQYYLDGEEGTLKDYMDYIEANGFFSPYQPNLRIEVDNR